MLRACSYSWRVKTGCRPSAVRDTALTSPLPLIFKPRTARNGESIVSWHTLEISAGISVFSTTTETRSSQNPACVRKSSHTIQLTHNALVLSRIIHSLLFFRSALPLVMASSCHSALAGRYRLPGTVAREYLFLVPGARAAKMQEHC